MNDKQTANEEFRTAMNNFFHTIAKELKFYVILDWLVTKISRFTKR